MRIANGQLQISASDLAKHLACRHLSIQDLLAARGELQRPLWHDPGADVLAERGMRHEAAYLSYLAERDCEVLAEDRELNENDQHQRTLNAMRSGIRVIAQAYLKDGKWRGRADILLRVDTPSNLGNWSYEVVDTKLANETKGGTILQLCLYSELVGRIQGPVPEYMHVVTPGRNFQPETFRIHDYVAYYRFVKSRLEREIKQVAPTYPDPVEHCELCHWWPVCNDRRRKDDHPSFVAGISKMQIDELRKWNVKTLSDLAKIAIPVQQKPERGSRETYEKIREQARLQLEYRETKKPVYELLDMEPKRGLARLPEPSPGDVFLDFESDPFVEEQGLEYLLGYATLNEAGQPSYRALWAFHRVDERRAFETFMDAVTERLKQFPDLHIYHFTHYEPTALKRLMGRYSTRQDEMDQMLRGELFVDLYGVVKQALRASVETYSLKELEQYFNFKRDIDLKDARQHLRIIECALELNDIESIPAKTQNIVEGYNRDDCVSTFHLRNWLEEIRSQEIRGGKEITRPLLESSEPSDAVSERRQRLLAVMERLLHNVPEDPTEQNGEQHAKWLLAQMLEWHRREEKVSWWEYFRLKQLIDEELLEERCAISGLQFVVRVGGTARAPIDRYRYPPQDMDVRDDDELKTSDASFGKVVAIDITKGIVDVKKRMAMADVHPTSAFVHRLVPSEKLAESLLRMGTWVADTSVDGPGKYCAGRDLLLRNTPRLGASGWLAQGLPAESFPQIVLDLDHSVLPIQGPPGAGKTHTGARMICALLKANKKVGITAVSHKVIRKLCDEVVQAAQEENLTVRGIQKVPDLSANPNALILETEENSDVLDALNNGEAHFGAGTAWLWAREEYSESVDVLFVDEAGQMTLADVLAVSQGAKSIVLLGDPQQLEQPIQGTHPPGVAVSALQHILGDHKTMPQESGLFLSETWRLSPAICLFTSELFYENRLKSREGCGHQKIVGSTRFAGSGLWYVPVVHDGNQSSSLEEADVVEGLVKELVDDRISWINDCGILKPLKLDDILIVAPYNAQVFEIAKRIPGGRIGTVDKFQGQQAPVVIYSMATSSPEDAPRGMEFLYSLNRFNVATSRARCACILVASPRVFEPECKTPHQMKLANVLCRYREMAT